MVLVTTMLLAFATTISAPAVVVSMVAVDSPGNGGVIKRDTISVVLSAPIDI